MILIGSMAAKYWFDDFRNPNDIDVVATVDEVRMFLERRRPEITGKSKNNNYIFIKLGDRTWQFEIPKAGNESALLINGEEKIVIDGIDVLVAPPETLFAIKKSHLFKPLKQHVWEKHIRDYHFFKNKNISVVDDGLVDIRRFECNIKRPVNLNMTNDEFFKASEHMVSRKYDHDYLHEAVKFYDRPLYMKIKHDQSKAMCSEKLFIKLSYEEKINLVREEAFVIALERKVIPHNIDGRAAFLWALYRICTTLTKGWFREFACENYNEIASTDCDFVKNFSKINFNLEKL